MNRTRLLFSVVAAILVSQVASSQNLQLIPDCGKPTDRVCITGSGWQEPNPVCRYTFKFEGTTVAPDQPDGLYGPPHTYFNVPSVMPGNHTVHVELRLNDPDQLLQQKDATFLVV